MPRDVADMTRFIEIENDLPNFIKSFRGGVVVRDLIPDSPNMQANADYYFENDGVIAELKCLRTDPSNERLLFERLVSVCKKLGYSEKSTWQIALREIPLPSDVAQGVVQKSLSYIEAALRKASNQILSTKNYFGRPDIAGVVVISNEENTVLTPAQIFEKILSLLSGLDSQAIDALIYVSPNLYFVADDGSSRTPWLPAYKLNPDQRLVNFIDDMGSAWCRYLERLDESLLPSLKLNQPRLADFDHRITARSSKA